MLRFTTLTSSSRQKQKEKREMIVVHPTQDGQPVLNKGDQLWDK